MARQIFGYKLHDENRIYDFVAPVYWFFEALLVVLFWGLSWLMPVAWGSAMGARLMAWIGPRSSKHRHVLANLTLALPGKSREEIETIATGVWRNLGATLAEYPHLRRILREPGRLEIVLTPEGREAIEKSAVMFAAAHIANWEVAATAVLKMGLKVSAIYSPQQNPYWDRLIQRRRRALGCQFIPKEKGAREMLRRLKAGETIGLLPDQRVDSGRLVPFFGVDCHTTISASKLIARIGRPLVPLHVERLPAGRFRVTFHAPIYADPGIEDADQQAVEMTRRLHAYFEDWITAHPDQWLCLKRRWPKASYPESSGYKRPGVTKTVES